MADLLAQSAAWHAGIRRGWLSSPVTYTRGNVSLAGLLAEFAKMSDEAMQGEGDVYLAVDEYQFRFSCADLILNGTPTTPKSADRITDAAGVIYEVTPTKGQNAWEYTDHNLRYRVFCKRVLT